MTVILLNITGTTRDPISQFKENIAHLQSALGRKIGDLCIERSIDNYSHNSNMKCVGSTIKCISFEPIHYVIILDIVLSLMVFGYFNFMFLSMYC